MESAEGGTVEGCKEVHLTLFPLARAVLCKSHIPGLWKGMQSLSSWLLRALLPAQTEPMEHGQVLF